MPLGPKPAVFLAHSYRDQSAAYAISEWICQLWPNVSLFVTHTGLTGREQVEEHSMAPRQQ